MQYLRLDNILEDVTIDGSETIRFERLRFNGGENHIKLTSPVQEQVTIEAQLKNSDYVIELFLATDALRRAGAKEISLLAPYIPYGRQDRVMVSGEPLSIKVFAQLLNAQNYEAVYTLDNHSPVATALIDRCIEISNHRILKKFIFEVVGTEMTFVSPDAGALKKTQKLGQQFNRRVVTASKVRDVTDGRILETKVHIDALTGLDCYIIDDICDGGRTFIELAKVLKEKGCNKVILYVSHGIFSNGLPDLLEHIDRVYTTNCFRADIVRAYFDNELKVVRLRKEDLK